MTPYLADLSALLAREVHERDLWSLEQTDAARAATKELVREPPKVLLIDTAEANANRCSHFIERLVAANSSPVSLWMTHAIDCGALPLPSLRNASIDLRALTKRDGIVSIVTTDWCDRLLFDLVGANQARPVLRIEIQGRHWPGVAD
ncbi:hypothetical protein ACA040_002937 [Xenophilus aerolatus]